MELPTSTPAELAGLLAWVVVLTLAAPATAASYLGFRLPKKEIQFKQLLHRLGVGEKQAAEIAQGAREEYRWVDYLLPVGFASLVTLLGSYVLFLGGETFVTKDYNLLLQGMSLAGADWARDPYLANEWRRLLVIGFAFAGTFVWGALEIIRRLVTADLTPLTYWKLGLRGLFSVAAALMLSYFLEAAPGTEYTENSLPVLAFLAGAFPDRALRYLRERVPIFSRNPDAAAHELPLEMIEGMNVLHRTRLEEEGIDNAQNLAEANIFELALKTPYNPAQMIDWIAQAKLLVYVKAGMPALRRLGIRSALDLRRIAEDDARIDQLAQESAIPKLALASLCASLQADTTLAELGRFRDGLGARFPTAESPEPPAGASSGPVAPASIAGRHAA